MLSTSDFFRPGHTIFERGELGMNVKGWAITAGISAAAGAVAILMMPRTNPTRNLAAKAANKVEDVAWRIEDKMNKNSYM